MSLEDIRKLKMMINERTTIYEILNLPAFQDFGRLLFPVNRSINLNMTLKELSSSQIYLWYSHIDVCKTVEIIKTLYHQAQHCSIFYNIYSQAEI